MATIPNQTSLKPTLFLGKGLLSPLREDPDTGDFQRVRDENNVKQCLRDGVLTMLGERLMAESIGTIARTMLFEETDKVADLLEPSIRDHVERYEPRVVLSSLTVTNTSLTHEVATFNVSLIYIVRATNRRENLVFPFYLRSDVLQGG